MYLLESANIMFLSFIRYELLSFEHGNPISHKMYNIIMLLFVSLLGYNQVSFSQRYSISFPFIFYTLCPYLESLTCFHGKYLIVKSSIFVCTSCGQKSRMEVSSRSYHLK